MTCIVGMVRDGIVHLGGDALTGKGDLLKDGKVWSDGPYIFGLSGMLAVQDIIRHRWLPPSPPPDKSNLIRFMHTQFVDSLKPVLADLGDIYAEDVQSSLLVGVRGHLFKLVLETEKSYLVFEPALLYDAIGSGGWAAAGALHALHDLALTMDAVEMLRRALEAAETIEPTVRQPFSFVQTAS